MEKDFLNGLNDYVKFIEMEIKSIKENDEFDLVSLSYCVWELKSDHFTYFYEDINYFYFTANNTYLIYRLSKEELNNIKSELKIRI